MITKLLERLLIAVLPFESKRRIKYIGLKNCIVYGFFQRILRVNSHVPWPTHWSSIVSSPKKIVFKYWRPYPGYMPGCYIQALNGIEIGRNIRIGPRVCIISANHNIDDFDKHDKAPPIVIGDNCWLGAGCIILSSVVLGNHVIVAAGAVVTKSFACNCIIGGVPAEVIREIGPYKGKADW